MILKDNFYLINELLFEENTISAKLQLNADHPIFEGHFPNNPVTPGVIEMEIIKEVVGLAIEQPVKMKAMSSCKFLTILNPNDTPEIMVNITILEREGQRIRISGSISDAEKAFMKIGAEYFIA
jgi:3-hydroxyacyl-[acyl-carrier-protein] dehydratase